MSIMDLFSGFRNGDSRVPNGASSATPGTQQAQQQQSQVQPQPGNIPQGSNQTQPGNTTVPATQTEVKSNTETKAESPLDKFGDIWNTKPSGQGETTPYFNIDRKKIQEAASTMNFTAGIAPEKLKAIAAGGEDAVKALAEIVNQVGQNVYENSALATTALIEKSLGTAGERFNSSLESKFKSFQSTQSLAAENPALRDPKFAPIVDSFRDRAITKFPNASAAEINGYTNEFFNEFIGALQAPEVAKKTQAQQSQGIDWDKWLTS